MVVGRKLGVESGGTEHVECCDCLWDESTPKVGGKSFVGAIQNGDEVAFERSDRSFGEVVPVVVCIGKLVVELFCFYGCYELLGHFVVQALKSWNDPRAFELVVAVIIASDEVLCLAALDWGCKDGIAVIIVEYKDVVVALA